MPKDFITIGTDTINQECFSMVSRPEEMNEYKPLGGLWATEYLKDSPEICAWANYIAKYPELIRLKKCDRASIFTLNPNANIAIINGIDVIKTLSEKYPSIHHKLLFCDKEYIIDYEKMANDFDGIFVMLDGIPNNLKKPNNIFGSYDVDSLQLFNLDCIKDYRPVKLYTKKGLKIKSIQKSLYVDPKRLEYYALYDYIKKLFDNVLKEMFTENYIFNYEGYLKRLNRVRELMIEQIRMEKDSSYKKASKSYGHDVVIQIINTVVNNLIIEQRKNDEGMLLKLTFGS